MVWYLLPIIAYLAVRSKDMFKALMYFSIFNLMLFAGLIIRGLLYLSIFQFGVFVGTVLLVILMSIGD